MEKSFEEMAFEVLRESIERAKGVLRNPSVSEAEKRKWTHTLAELILAYAKLRKMSGGDEEEVGQSLTEILKDVKIPKRTI